MERTLPRAGQLQFETTKRYFTELIENYPALRKVLQEVPSPSLVVNLTGVRERIREIKREFEGFDVYYAVKANDHPEILKVVLREGCGFEVASSEELKRVLEIGGVPDRIISSNPVKPFDFLEDAYKSGVRTFAVDSFAEVEKIAEVSPRSKVYVRLTVPNEGSEWPLTRKFGLDPGTALEVLLYAREKGLIPVGITFHVGSQCNNLRNWFIAIKNSYSLWEMAFKEGLRLSMLNIGGGLPVRYLREALRPSDIAYYVRGLLKKYFPADVADLQMEPGRGIVGDHGILVAQVIGKARRGEENWLYVNTGVFNGLAEALGGIRYPVYIEREGELKEWTLAGVSCDSMDVIAKNIYLPEPEVGDRLYFLSAGAYTTVYASRFNGFEPPRVLCLEL
jgi:ornithine decarboxylase